MSRRRHVDLDSSSTVMLRGAGARARHRADVEEALREAMADGDRERVSLLREALIEAEQ